MLLNSSGWPPIGRGVATSPMSLRRRFTSAMAVFGGGAAVAFFVAGFLVDRLYFLWGLGAAFLAVVGVVQLFTGRHVPAGYVVVVAALGVAVAFAGIRDDFPALFAAAALFAASVVFVSKSRREVSVAFVSMFVSLLLMSILQSHESGPELWADTAINGVLLVLGFGFENGKGQVDGAVEAAGRDLHGPCIRDRAAFQRDLASIHEMVNAALERVAALDPGARGALEHASEELGRILEQRQA